MMGKRRSVAARVIASYVAVLTAFVLTTAWSVVSERRAIDEAELLRTGYVPLKFSVERALDQEVRIGADLNHITEAQNPVEARSIRSAWLLRPRMFADIRALAHNLATLRDRRAPKMSADLIREAVEVEQYLQGDADRLNRLFESLDAHDTETAQRLQNELVSYEVEGKRRLRDLKERIDRRMDDLVSETRVRERRAVVVLIALSAITLAVGIGVSLYTRRVLKPLGAVTARAKAVANGDLTPRQVVASNDEIGELAATFENMVSAIARTNAELVLAERLAAIGKMAAHVTHEIRNPLSSMGLNIELLEEELAQGGDLTESRQLVRAIKRETDRLAELSEQYLRVARRPTPNLERASLADLVTEVVEFVRPELKTANVTCTVEAESSLPCSAFDEGQIRQALLNLVRNAREAMQPAGGVLVLRLAATPEGGALLIVEDEGSGMTPEVREKIFDPFFTTKPRGTGLGLAVTRQIVLAHGGSIDCEPRSPKGTRFLIRLPEAADEPRRSATQRDLRLEA